MGDIDRVALFGKLNGLAYKSIEGATVFCKLRGNPYVELVHWFHQILQNPNSDVACIVRAFNIDAGRLSQNFTEALDRLPRGATSISDLSSHLEEAVERTKTRSRQLAKRQLTWFRREEDIKWFEPSEDTAIIEYVRSQTQ